ncbi:MAG: LptF/LptG family permease [Candidatus Latescibacteria bacterium]|nr:LptF/LptG family permease [Candidatus Latescibacterota bacterium]
MTLLDFYLLRRFVFCFLVSVLALLLISATVDLTENIDLFIDFAAGAGQILRYYLYRAPYWIILTLPVSALLGTLFALTSFNRRNEITAMKAAGANLYRLLLPVFVCALVISGLAFLFTDRIVPGATFRYHVVRDEIRSHSRTDGSRRQVLLQDVDGQLIWARRYDAEGLRAYEIQWEKVRDYTVEQRLTAAYMQWTENGWLAVQGASYRFDREGGQVSQFDTLQLASLTLRPEDLARQHKKPDEMSFAELQAYIARSRANGEDATRHLVDLYLKISFPLTSFFMVVLGAPLATQVRRRDLASSFGWGIIICMAYYSCVKAGQALGWNKVAPPLLGAWLGNILFGLLSLLLLRRSHK